MSSLRKLASETAVYGLSQILGKLVNYLLVPLYTRIFLPEEYGVVNLLYAYLSFLNVILTYGMETAFFRFISKNEGNVKIYSTAFISILSSSLGFLLLSLPFSSLISDSLSISNHPELIRYFIAISAFDAIAAIPFAWLRYQKKALRFALIKNIGIFSNIGLNLYFLVAAPYATMHWNWHLPFTPTSPDVSYIFVSNLISSFICLPLLWPQIRLARHGFDAQRWKEMFHYAFPLLWVGIAGMINETLDRALIFLYPDTLTGQKMIGIYGANYKLSILMTLFIQAFRYAAEPFFFNHAKNNDKRKIYADVMNYFVIVCCFLFMLVMLNLNWVKHFIGSKYHEGLQVVPILLLANLFLGIYYNLSVWYKMTDKTNYGAYISGVGAFITLIVNALFIPTYGYMASAWATFICYGTMMVLCYGLGQKHFHVPYQIRRLFIYVGFAVFSWLLFQFATDNWHFFNGWIQYTASFILIFAFLFIAFRFERSSFQSDFS